MLCLSLTLSRALSFHIDFLHKDVLQPCFFTIAELWQSCPSFYVDFYVSCCVCCCCFRDLVHRQTAAAAVKHMSLGVYGFGCEDALNHLLNYVWPNVFEVSPHVIQNVLECVEGMRVAIGPSRVLQYTLQGLFHPARRVRQVYWKIYNSLYIGSQVRVLMTSLPGCIVGCFTQPLVPSSFIKLLSL